MGFRTEFCKGCELEHKLKDCSPDSMGCMYKPSAIIVTFFHNEKEKIQGESIPQRIVKMIDRGLDGYKSFGAIQKETSNIHIVDQSPIQTEIKFKDKK